MDRDPSQPIAWANFLVKAWGPVFPIDVRQIALEYSERYTDPIKAVEPAQGANFEGALYPLARIGKWTILYNPNIRSKGRINFTIAHEFGHFLVHREAYRDGITCGQTQLLGIERDPVRRKVEQEADNFASYLLMPMDDFREQVASSEMTLELL